MKIMQLEKDKIKNIIDLIYKNSSLRVTKKSIDDCGKWRTIYSSGNKTYLELDI